MPSVCVPNDAKRAVADGLLRVHGGDGLLGGEREHGASGCERAGAHQHMVVVLGKRRRDHGGRGRRRQERRCRGGQRLSEASQAVSSSGGDGGTAMMVVVGMVMVMGGVVVMMGESVVRDAHAGSVDARQVTVLLVVMPVRNERADLLGRGGGGGWEGGEYVAVSAACRPESSCRWMLLHRHHPFSASQFVRVLCVRFFHPSRLVC